MEAVSFSLVRVEQVLADVFAALARTARARSGSQECEVE